MLQAFKKITIQSLNACPVREIIDFLHPGETIFIAPHSEFIDALTKLAPSLNFVIRYLDKFTTDHTFWIRDVFFTVPVSSRQRETYSSPPSFYSSSRINELISIKGRYTSGAEKNPMLLQREISNLSNPFAPRHKIPNEVMRQVSPVDLDGGNLISTINKFGLQKYIVGEYSLLSTGMLEEVSDHTHKSPFVSKKSIKKHSLAYHGNHVNQDKLIARLREKAKRSIQKALHCDHSDQINQDNLIAWRRERAKRSIQKALNCDISTKIIVIPQWEFHIDLQLAYLGDGIILLHSFEETQNYLKSHNVPITQVVYENYEYIEKDCRSEVFDFLDFLLKNNTESIINEIARKLEKHGFTVIKCMGGISIKGEEKRKDQKKIYFFKHIFNFMNGIAGISASKQKYYLVMNTHLDWAKDYFAELLEDHTTPQVDPYYLNMKPISNFPLDKSTLHTSYCLSLLRGGLRCQTNLGLSF